MTQRNIGTCDVVQRKLVYRMYNRVFNASNPILQNMMRSGLCFDSMLRKWYKDIYTNRV